MHYVYVLQNIRDPKVFYKGYSSNLRQRISDHSENRSRYAGKNGPWKLVHYSAFENKYVAIAFERYLKSGSGLAFMKKRLIQNEITPP